MISFLISVDRTGVITAARWSNPAHIFPPYVSSFPECFSDMDQAAFSALLELAGKDFYYYPTTFHLKDYAVNIHLCLLPAEEFVLLFGFEENLLGELSAAAKEIIRRFMHVVADCSKENIILSMKTSRVQFEKIQSLNNELVNTRRLLEKTNAMLHTANKDLNNRLVKDALTGLVSRYQYRTEMEQCIALHPGKLGVFTFIDIDSFKEINDTYGHAAGDKYLIEFAERLKKLPLAHTIKLRIAGDEFGLFSYALERSQSQYAEEIWRQIKSHVVHKPVIIDGIEMPLAISAGMSVYGIDTFDIYELIEYADFAMYQAKRNGKNQFAVFDQAAYQQGPTDKAVT